MAFKRSDEKEGLELTSLIDIVFLLLIFFLVSFAFSLAGDVSESKVYSEMRLPHSHSELPVIENDLLNNLMIQISVDSSKLQPQRMAYVLWPAYESAEKMTRGMALRRALSDSTFAPFPADYRFLPKNEFVQTQPCTLIANSIARYVEMEKRIRHVKRPIVEIRAEQNTEFKIVDFIMETCSVYGDEMPQVIVRTAL